MHGEIIGAGGVVVITGAASGIGLAFAKRCAGDGARVCLADREAEPLERARREVAALAPGGEDTVRGFVTDVASFEQVLRLKDAVFDAFGSVTLLVNNAAVGIGAGVLEGYERWQALMNVNFWGVLHGIQAFVPAMREQQRRAAIVNVGSKQGITTPPGNAAYNVSKACVKVVTEQLAHELRQLPGSKLSAHLLVPGWTHTAMTAPRAADPSQKPDGAWLPERVVDYFLERFHAGDFYILCPDDQVSRALDERRIQWAADDLIQNRPALSRWHPDYQDAYAAFVKGVS